MNTNKRILVVEDDLLTSGAIKMVLEWEGYHVDCAVNGLEALHYLRWSEEKPDLILLDVRMPVLNGRRFRHEQLSDPYVYDIPVVVVSGAANSSSLDASGHLYKPFQPEELLQVVRSQT